MAETVLYFVYYVRKANGKNEGDIESVEEIQTVVQQENLSLDIDVEELRSRLTRPVRDRLQEVFIDSPEVLGFIDQTLDLSRILRIESAVIQKSEMYQQKADDASYIRLLVNLERVNNVRWVNRYFFRGTQDTSSGWLFYRKDVYSWLV